MEQLLDILQRMHPDVDFETNDDLIGEGVLDSLDIVTLITEINTTFDVSIPAEEVIPENFNSAEAIFAMIHGSMISSWIKQDPVDLHLAKKSLRSILGDK